MTFRPRFSKTRSLAVISLATVVAGITHLSSGKLLARNRVEEPKYTVVAKHTAADFDYEVRAYAPQVVAQTVVKAKTRRAASNAGFRILAKYIFGGNHQRSEIAMTAPVQVNQGQNIEMTTPVQVAGKGQSIEMTAPVGQTETADGWVITFTMPSEWTLESLPVPNDARVELREVPERQVAVRSFSGAPGPKTVQTRMDEFVAELTARGFRVREGVEPVYARYDPPWTPWFLRRNEIHVELAAVPG